MTHIDADLDDEECSRIAREESAGWGAEFRAFEARSAIEFPPDWMETTDEPT